MGFRPFSMAYTYMASILLFFITNKKSTSPAAPPRGRGVREEAMYSSAIASPHALFVLPCRENDGGRGSSAPLQDVAELRLPTLPFEDDGDGIAPLLAAVPPHAHAACSAPCF